MTSVVPFGPIRPEHATDGWQLAGGKHEWWLVCDLGRFNEIGLAVRATSRTTIEWRAERDGRLARRVVAASVDDAKEAAMGWALSVIYP